MQKIPRLPRPLPQNPMYLSDPGTYRVPGWEWEFVHIGSSVQKTVIFLGVPRQGAPGDFQCTGTAFFVYYQNLSYLVTARHCVESFEGREYEIRVNMSKGGSGRLKVAADHRWFYHPDPAVDVAITPVDVDFTIGVDVIFIDEDSLLTEETMKEYGVGVGDTCYTVGLFRFIPGDTKNVPLVYTGHIALHGDETIPLWQEAKGETEHLKGGLIQTGGIEGASGSPIFVRPAIKLFDQALVHQKNVYLYGLLVRGWFLPPDEAARAAMGGALQDRVSVGLGVVVRTPQIIEVLERDDVTAARKAKMDERAKNAACVPLTVPIED